MQQRCTHHWARMYQPIERHGTLGEKQAGRDKLLLLTLGASQQGRQRWGTALELWGLIQERFRQGKPEAKQAGHDRSAAAHPCVFAPGPSEMGGRDGALEAHAQTIQARQSRSKTSWPRHNCCCSPLCVCSRAIRNGGQGWSPGRFLLQTTLWNLHSSDAAITY
eukprot:1161650-Pelagomonas_calceolata.AAC.3